MILKNAGLYIFLIGCCNFLVSTSLFAQKGLEQNTHVKYEVTLDESIYTIQYSFKDHFGNHQNYELVLPHSYTQQAINKFGVPTWLFEPYTNTENNRKVRQNEMSKGLFMLDDNLIEVDKSAVIHYYLPHFYKPIAEMIVSSLADYGKDTRRDRIEMAMRFVQDIPYGIPHVSNQNRHYGGVIPPPQILIEGYGDCDSKVILFVGILMYLIPGDDIIFLNQDDHVLAAVKEKPAKGLTYIEFNGQEYLVAETAGPGKRLLGQKGNYYRKNFKVETLRFVPPEPLPFRNDVIAHKPLLNAQNLENNILVITNISDKGFKFQISADNQHWQNFYLSSNTYGNYVLENEQQVYLRYRDRGSNFNVYKVHTGNNYSFTWNNQKKLWEIKF